MSSFVGTCSTSSPHSLRTRWSTLDTRLVGRCVEEHEQLIGALQRGITNAGIFTTLASNAKLRGLLDAVSQRRGTILEFIVHHRTVHGNSDTAQIAVFERLLEKLSAAEQRAIDWDNSRHLLVTPRGTIMTHRRPLVSAAAAALAASHLTPRRGPAVPLTTNVVSHAPVVNLSFTPQRRSRSAPNISHATPNAMPSSPGGAEFLEIAPPPPPIGYLFDYSVEAAEVKGRLSIHHDEFFALDHLYCRYKHCRPVVVVPHAPLRAVSSFTELMEELRPRVQQCSVWDVVCVVVVILFLANVLVGLVRLLEEIDDLLDSTIRPYGRQR